MSGVSATGAASAATATTPAKSRGMDNLGQGDFLRLMTKQLTTQDPFNPVDNTDMIAQMAQFSQVSGIAEINQKLTDLIKVIEGATLLVPTDPAPPTTSENSATGA